MKKDKKNTANKFKDKAVVQREKRYKIVHMVGGQFLTKKVETTAYFFRKTFSFNL